MEIFHGIDVYKTYLAMKHHFTKDSFDFFKYDGKVRVKESTYQARNDFYFFEQLAAKLTAQEVREYMLASFIYSDNPSKVWIGDIRRNGKDVWSHWQKRYQALEYNVKNDLGTIRNYMEKYEVSFNDMFDCSAGHPPLLKLYIRKAIGIETFIILDMVLKFVLRWDRHLNDPVWTPLSMKVKKTKPFMSINVKNYRSLMKEVFM